jgi:predicted nucleotidyltransferase
MNFSVTDELLREAVRRIVLAGNPQKIVLFGSRARGDHRADSDLDLLIIENSDLPRYKRSPRYYRSLRGLFLAKDIVVWTPMKSSPGRLFPTPSSPRPCGRGEFSMKGRRNPAE